MPPQRPTHLRLAQQPGGEPPTTSPVPPVPADEGSFLRSLLGHLSDGVVACDAAGQLTYMNATAREWHGRGPDGTGREDWVDRFSLTDLAGAPLAPQDVPLARILDGSPVVDVPLVLRPEGRPPRTVLCSGERLLGDDGAVRGAVVSMRDVTAQRAAEARAARRATALATTVEAQRTAVALGSDVPAVLECLAVFALRALPGAAGSSVLLRHTEVARWLPELVGRDDDGAPLVGDLADGEQWSAAAHETVVGVASAGTRASAVGTPVPVAGSLAGTAMVRRRTQRSGDVPGDPRIHHNPDLAVGVGSMLIVPLLLDGDAVGVVQVTHGDPGAFDRDDEYALEVLTGSVAAQLQHADARGLLEEHAARLALAASLKDDLISLLGHDVQNPLASIVGYAELAADELDPGHAAMPALEAVQRAADRIRRIVREVLTLVSLDGEGLRARPAPTRLSDRVRAAVELSRAADRVRVVGETGLVALVQEEHLDQVLLNLLTNADKYAGGATAVEITTERDEAGEPRAALVHVDDEGAGIAADLLPTLFDRFTRAAGDDRVTGTGLGLYLSRTLAEANGGTLEHHVRPGGGSRFTLRLPLPIG